MRKGLSACWLGAVQSSTDAESYSSLSLDSLNSCPKKWSAEGPREAEEADTTTTPPRPGPSPRTLLESRCGQPGAMGVSECCGENGLCYVKWGSPRAAKA